MTREEAVKIMNGVGNSSGAAWVTRLEALGLLKFEEKKEINRLFEINTNNIHWDAAKLYPNDLTKFNNKYGVVRLELWPEGLVLWVGGEIVWKSWTNPPAV